MKDYKQFINESSLSRLWKHNTDHDCGALTAFRNARDCGEGEPYTKKENAQRNKSLLAKLKSKGYGVTKLNGTYPEGGSVGKEESFFVVDLKDSGTLEKELRRLGAEFDQDSILFVEKGAMDVLDKKNPAKGYLIGTNKCENAWPGFGKKDKFKRARIGHTSPIYTSIVNGRPFIFEEVGKEVMDPGNGMGVWAMYRAAEKDWQELDD